MLQSQLTKGNNGLVKRKYITFGIEADSLRTAKPKLERIETDILNNFKTLGVKTEPLSGYERLKVLHDVFNMDTNEPFRFSFDMVARTGLSTKDFIAPTSFDFREGKCFKMGRTIGAVSFLQILAPELNDRMLADLSLIHILIRADRRDADDLTAELLHKGIIPVSYTHLAASVPARPFPCS